MNALSETQNTDLRLLPDFEHTMSLGAKRSRLSPQEHYTRLVQVSTALEGVAVLLNEVECKRIRADYLTALLAPQIRNLSESVCALCDNIKGEE